MSPIDLPSRRIHPHRKWASNRSPSNKSDCKPIWIGNASKTLLKQKLPPSKRSRGPMKTRGSHTNNYWARPDKAALMFILWATRLRDVGVRQIRSFARYCKTGGQTFLAGTPRTSVGVRIGSKTFFGGW